jgi:serine/threonine protein kinase
VALSAIGRYPILRKIGEGGFATVYLAEDNQLHDLVAIKILQEKYVEHADLLSRFVAEARLIRKLRAPGLVRVHDGGEYEGRPYFVMEYCERGTMQDRIDELHRPLTIDEGAGLARALATALSGVHDADQPVVHRDLKPSNLLLRRSPTHNQTPVGEVLRSDEELLLGDFGLAKVVDLDATQYTIFAFSRGYAAPEQVLGDPTVDQRADVYAASAVIVKAISGVSPLQVQVESQSAFDESALACTGRLRPVLERGLAFHRAGRPATIAAWAAEIDRLDSAEGLDRKTKRSDPPDRPPAELYQPPKSEPVGSSQSEVEVSVVAPASATTSSRSTPPSARSAAPDAQSRAGPDLSASPASASPASASPASAQPLEALPAPIAARRRFRPKLRHALVAVAITVTGIVAVLMAINGRGGPAIIGPRHGPVGEQVAFAVAEGEVADWLIGEQRTLDPVALLTPTSPGTVTITVTTDQGTSSVDYVVEAATSALRISGPSHLTVNQSIELTVVPASGAELMWTVNGSAYRVPADRPSLKLNPTSPGLMVVSVVASDGQQAERTFTVTANT